MRKFRYLFLFMIAVIFSIGAMQASVHAASAGKNSSEKLQIRHVRVQGSGGRYTVTGKAKGNYFYTVEDGHNVLVPEKILLKKVDKLKWTPFKVKIILAKKQLPPNGTIVLYAYERDSQGKMVRGYSILLEKFYR
ncbi:hypothetical protein ACF5W4_04985 [Bacillota bacterium Lsc_1132]